jgi:hypothetical protein
MHSTCVARPFASVLLPPLPTRCSATARAHPVATRVRRRAGEIGLRCGVAALVAAGLTFLQPISLAHAEPAPLLVGIPRVVDGDTLEVAGERVRFFGMDAPESKQLCTTSGGEEYLCGAPSSQPLPVTRHRWFRVTAQGTGIAAHSSSGAIYDVSNLATLREDGHSLRLSVGL